MSTALAGRRACSQGQRKTALAAASVEILFEQRPSGGYGYLTLASRLRLSVRDPSVSDLQCKEPGWFRHALIAAMTSSRATELCPRPPPGRQVDGPQQLPDPRLDRVHHRPVGLCSNLGGASRATPPAQSSSTPSSPAMAFTGSPAGAPRRSQASPPPTNTPFHTAPGSDEPESSGRGSKATPTRAILH